MTKIEINSIIEKFGIRQMQAYAALCLYQFCCHLDIKHSAIDELVNHLLKILYVENLPDWEQSGAELDITGRGDPLPDDVASILPESHYDDFESLVECAVEVGIADMYGASTEQPKSFLKKCIDILDNAGVGLPTTEFVSKYRANNDPWGGVITHTEFDDFLNKSRIEVSSIVRK